MKTFINGVQGNVDAFLASKIEYVTYNSSYYYYEYKLTNAAGDKMSLYVNDYQAKDYVIYSDDTYEWITRSYAGNLGFFSTANIVVGGVSYEAVSGGMVVVTDENTYAMDITINLTMASGAEMTFTVNGKMNEENGGGNTPAEPTKLATPSVSGVVSGNAATISWQAVAGAKDYTVTCGSQSQTVASTTATFEGLEYETEDTISVVANPADEAVNSVSEAGTTKATTEADPNASTEAQTIAIAFPADFPEGAASGNSVGTIYSGDVIISSTGSWRTDKTDGRDCIYIGRTTSNELRIEAQNGKTITKVTLGAPTGYLVDLKAKEYDGYTTTTFADTTTAEWTGECKSRIVYTAAGNSHSNIATITVEYK